MSVIDSVKKLFKGKGKIKNHSSKTLWVVETTTKKLGKPATAHKLGSKRRSPKDIDADGFKRVDGKSTKGHSSWWKILDYTTADIYDDGDGLTIKVVYMRPVPEHQFGDVAYDPNENWGEPMKYVTNAERGKAGTIEKYFVEEKGWLSKFEAVALAENDEIDNAVVVHPKNGQPYLRSRPDKKKSNNFSEMAKT
ncbi:DUF3892 domain-containing protein [Deltaproteobacteria bacterium TL4]